MSELETRAALLRAQDAAGRQEAARTAQAHDEYRRRSEEQIGLFIGALTRKNRPTVPLFVQTYRKGGPEYGDRRSGRHLEYRDVQTGFAQIGQGWVVREYDHNGGDILDGVFVLDSGLYTRRLTRVEHAPDRSLQDVPEVPFYTTSPHVVVNEASPAPIVAADILPQGVDFAYDDGQKLLARALMRYGVA